MAKETTKAAAKTSSIMDMINNLEGTTVSEDLSAANTMEAEVREMAESKMKEEEKKEKADPYHQTCCVHQHSPED